MNTKKSIQSLNNWYNLFLDAPEEVSDIEIPLSEFSETNIRIAYNFSMVSTIKDIRDLNVANGTH